MSDLKTWLERILKAGSTEEVFGVVEEFRPLPWTDEERSSMSKTYNAKLSQFNTSSHGKEGNETEKSKKRKDSKNISRQDAGNQRGESTSADKEIEEEDLA